MHFTFTSTVTIFKVNISPHVFHRDLNLEGTEREGAWGTGNMWL